MPHRLNDANAVLKAFHDLSTQGRDQCSSKFIDNGYGLQAKDFIHGGRRIRGLAVNSRVAANQLIFAIKKEAVDSAHELQEARFQNMSRVVSHALWLAEKKAFFNASANTSKFSAIEKLWKSYIDSLPTLQDYQAAGTPGAGHQEDLVFLSHLPVLRQIPEGVERQWEDLAAGLRTYNDSLGGDRPPLSWNDALWGLTNVGARELDVDGRGTIVPIADFANHAGAQANVEYKYFAGDGTLRFFARRELQPGEELTGDYGVKGMEWLKYGFIPDTGLGDSDLSQGPCAEILRALAEHKGGKMWDLTKQLVDFYCSANTERNQCLGESKVSDADPAESHIPHLQQGVTFALLFVPSPEILCRKRGLDFL